MKIGFRATCPLCESDLHVCKGCKFFCLGKPNDCLVPGTDPIKDREKNNLCEEFQQNTLLSKIEGDQKNHRKRFDDLFKNE